MVLWAIAIFFFFLGSSFLGEAGVGFTGGLRVGSQKRSIQKVVAVLREMEEVLGAGLVLSLRNWEELENLDDPWKNLATQSLKELRASGGALLPTLKRMRDLAEVHGAALEEARARAAQAFAQAMACSALVPLLGSSLYLLLPGVEQNLLTWTVACLLSLVVTCMASLWLLHLANAARWGGLRTSRQNWVLGAQCAGERFLALIRIGTPPDLAWTRACGLLSEEIPSLSSLWGSSVWGDSDSKIFASLKGQGKSEKIIGEAGFAIRKSIQISLMEGRPCLERVETVLTGLRQDLKSQVDRELSLLPTRALKPLFILVAPALLGLLVTGLYLAATDTMDLPG